MLDELLKAIKSRIPAEIIDGCNVDETAEMVMLEVEFTPVVTHGAHNYEFDPQKPADVVHQKDGRYLLTYPKDHDFEFVSESRLKVMRARFLLLKGWYYRNLRTMPYPMQQQVLAWYFPGGVWIPPEGSELAKIMGLE